MTERAGGDQRPALLRAVDIAAGYGREPIVKGIGLEVHHGQVALVMGPNGAGKSTFVKAVTGELPLLSGAVYLRGDDVSRWGEERRAAAGVGYVPQVRDVFPGLTVQENLEMGGYRLDRVRARERIAKVLDTFPQLTAFLRRPARQLSGGERKLVGVARALVPEPELIILDEPTANLSPRVAESVLEQVVTGLSRLNRGVLLIEQRVAVALERADTVLVLVDGRHRHSGPAAELRGMTDLSDLFFGRALAEDAGPRAPRADAGPGAS
ncbi:MAG TPA: ATP-binding cassette domain-containing protein [Acidimicrobiales bacterium]|nr:ATP-binding cassette domain-containing protein [Acidimicrobiales bacterium]